MKSPYRGKLLSKWDKITDELIKNHPLKVEEIKKVVLESWQQIFESNFGSFKIGKDIFPSPQIMSFFLHELVAKNLTLNHKNQFKVGTNKEEKDIVYVKDSNLSIEIKGSSNKTQIFGNRSYAQPNSGNARKNKDGYYITINFEKFTFNKDILPRILLIRFGYLEHTDWIAQKSATGQQARLNPDAYKHKLRIIYEFNRLTTKKGK